VNLGALDTWYHGSPLRGIGDFGFNQGQYWQPTKNISRQDVQKQAITLEAKRLIKDIIVMAASATDERPPFPMPAIDEFQATRRKPLP
jgi:hypothetical protein